MAEPGGVVRARWQPLGLVLPGGEPVLAEILTGGQTFQWREREGAGQRRSWRGVCGRWLLDLRLAGEQLEYRVIVGPDTESRAAEALRGLFAVETDFAGRVDRLPWRSDPVLARGVLAFPGLRILRQPWEVALLSFLLSPLKAIPQIRAGLEAIAARWGEPLAGGWYALPSWALLAGADEESLRACGIGYRARSVAACARLLADRPGYGEELAALPTAQARERLRELPGVGPKVADCVLLFGLGRLESFPIDTWIGRELREAYGLGDWKDPALQQFARAHFGPDAGLAQQFLFAAARRRTGRPSRA